MGKQEGEWKSEKEEQESERNGWNGHGKRIWEWKEEEK